jgi:dinuclear metal center YbgI/SA1388 family protein
MRGTGSTTAIGLSIPDRMPRITSIIGALDALLTPAEFEDLGPNGLQVPGPEEVSRVVTGVSAQRELIERAVEERAQLVLVHHGLFWDFLPTGLTPVLAERLRPLFKHDVALAAYHLPLDAHPEIGNNALLRDALGLTPDERPFGEAKGSAVGLIGRSAEPIDLAELRRRLAEAVGREPLVFDAGPQRISSVGIVSGGGGFAIHEAGPLGLDALITGEPTEPVMGEAREYGVHFLAGGHYATETFGIRRLGELVAERFALDQEFIDVPNPI